MPACCPTQERETAIFIGQPLTCKRLERQLDLLDNRPICIGWLVTPDHTGSFEVSTDDPVLGTLDDLETIVARRRPGLALISLPSVMKEIITSIRTRLRRLGIADRFMPTLEDQIAGVGPRTHVDVDLAVLLDRQPRQIDQAAVGDVIQGKSVLITGAGGSIGSEIARIVSRFQPAKLVLVDRSENALFEIDRQIARFAPQLSRKSLLHDVVDARATLAHFRELKPQVVFHAAAHKHVPMMEDHPAAAVDNNFFGTKSVADAADGVGVERFVMISTDKAVNPSSIMGATKRLAELYVQHINNRSGTAFSMVRFGNVLGSSGSVLDTWAKQISDGGPMTVTDPRMTRYFMTISEAAALVIQSAALADLDSCCGEVFLLNMGEPVRVLEMAMRFIRLHGLEPVLPSRPSSTPGQMQIVFTGARPGEKLHEELAFDGEAIRPTRHPDILIWELAPPLHGAVENMVRRLSPSIRQKDARGLAAQVRALIPEARQPIAA